MTRLLNLKFLLRTQPPQIRIHWKMLRKKNRMIKTVCCSRALSHTKKNWSLKRSRAVKKEAKSKSHPSSWQFLQLPPQFRPKHPCQQLNRRVQVDSILMRSELKVRKMNIIKNIYTINLTRLLKIQPGTFRSSWGCQTTKCSLRRSYCFLKVWQIRSTSRSTN